MEQRLSEIDVDLSLKWLLSVEESILTDQITAPQERKVLRSLQHWDASFFYFVKWYEVLKVFREDLQIRLRYEEVQLLDAYLDQHRSAYQRSLKVSEDIKRVTAEVVSQYRNHTGDTRQHVHTLAETFRDPSLDGYNRFKAFIRLIFIGFNYRDFDFLRTHFDYFDQMLQTGAIYSKRILLNYYSNRLLLHSRYREYQMAEKYGYLSIKVRNQDYLMYLNNLTAVLLRNQKYEEALQILQEGAEEAKVTGNDHNKTGYVAYYVETLNRLSRYRSAENHAAVFLSLYKREIFKYRWHVFFTAYLEALIKQNKHKEIVKLARRHKLLERDKIYCQRFAAYPIVSCYVVVAQYEEGLVNRTQLEKSMIQYLSSGTEAKKDQSKHFAEKLLELLPSDIGDLRILLKKLSSD